MSSPPIKNPIASDMAKTMAVKRIVCSRVGHTTFDSSVLTSFINVTGDVVIFHYPPCGKLPVVGLYHSKKVKVKGSQLLVSARGGPAFGWNSY